MAQMQPPLGWNAVVIIAHSVLRLAMNDWLYYASGFIQLFIIKWELCSTSVRFSDWKGHLLVSEVLKSLNFPGQNSDKLCWYASSYNQHHINCAWWILRTGQLFLHLWDWNIIAMVVREASYVIPSFSCLGCFITLLQDPHDFDDILEDVRVKRGLKDCKNENSLLFCFGVFCQAKCQWLTDFIRSTLIQWCNRLKIKSQPNSTYFWAVMNFFFGTTSCFSLIKSNRTRVVELNLILVKTFYTYSCYIVRSYLP